MRAIVWTGYGSPEGLQLQEVDDPVPKDNEILIRIHATTVTAGDCEMRDLRFPFLLRLFLRMYNGVTRPKRVTILGQEFAGVIESVGKDVTLFSKGDQVFGATGFSFGAYAEYICIPESAPDEGVISKKPENIGYGEAATFPVGGLNALHFLRKADIRDGMNVLINGAGGSIGTVGIQFAKSLGAEVTAVDSAGKLDTLRSIGADHVIDFTREDFTKNGEKYDIIFDVVGKASTSACMRSLKEKGIYLLGNPSFSRKIRGKFTARGDKRFHAGTASYRAEDLVFLRELIESGKVRPVIDRSYSLEQIPEAHRYVETGQKIGNVIITVEY